MPHYKDQWRAVADTVMILRFYKIQLIYWLSYEIKSSEEEIFSMNLFIVTKSDLICTLTNRISVYWPN